MTDPAILLAFAALIRGNFESAARHARQVQQRRTLPNQPGNREFAHYLLAQIAMAQGDYEGAQQHAQQAYAISLSMKDRWFRAYILNTLADLAVIKQQYATAQQHYETSYALRQEFNDAEGMAVALNHLSEIALRQGKYEEAQDVFEQSLQLYQEINDTGGLATSYNGLGDVALAQRDYETARHQYHQALRLAAEISFVSALLNVLLGIGELLCRVGRLEKGLPLLTLVQHTPAADQESKNRAAYLLDSFKLQLRAEQVAAAIEQGRQSDLDTTVKALLVELPVLDLSAPDAAPPVDPNQALVEPLTAREMDVLQLLADGLSNKEIAARLTIAEGTVKYYTRQIYGKLQVPSRIRAVAVAQELNLV